jgi:hypothetical protein
MITRTKRMHWYFSWLNNARTEHDLETKYGHIETYFKNWESQPVPELMIEKYKRRYAEINQI